MQIELVDAIPGTTPDRGSRATPSPIGRIATLATLATLVASLSFFARPESGNDAADEPITGPSTTIGSALATETIPDTNANSFPMPANGLDHVVVWDGGYLATGTSDGDATGPLVFVSPDASIWASIGRVSGAERVLALHGHDGGLRALTASAGPDGLTTLDVRVSVDGIAWQREVGSAEFAIPGSIRSGSLRGDRWVVLADEPGAANSDTGPGGMIFTGDLTSLELRIQIPPDERIWSYAAIESGFVAGVTRVDRRAPDGSRPHLVRWTGNWGLQDISDAIGTFQTAPELIDGERLALIVDSQLFVATDPLASSWRSALVAPADLPALLSSRAGPEILARASVREDPARIALSSDGLEWRSATVAGPDPELLAMSGDHAVIVVGESSHRRLLRVELRASRSLSEFFAKSIVERG